MLLPFGALLHPPAHQVDFVGGERGTGRGGGHAHRFVFGGDAANHFALAGIAGDDGVAAAKVGGGYGFQVEAEFGFAVSRIGAMAGVALVREDGADVAIELDWAFLSW